MGADRKTRARIVRAAAVAAAILAIVVALRAARAPEPGTVSPQAGPGAAGAPDARTPGSAEGERFHLDLGTPSPSAGWEEEAAIVAQDLRRLLDGRPRAGAYEEARSEAARRDLALHPPDRARLRRLLLGGERERVLALSALAARPDLDDDLLRIVLRSQRPEDDDLVRLLGAEVVQGTPPALLSRHDDDLLRAFARETNPLVLAVAFPALERMDEARLRALLRAQLAQADPEMLPILFGLARSRLGPGALEDLSRASGSAGGEAR